MSTLVAGIDCSTQSTKVLVCDAATGRGRPRRLGAAPGRHRGRPGGLGGRAASRRRPAACWTTWPRSRSAASSTAWSRWTRPARSSARPCSGTTPAPAGAATDLIAELGGPEKWADAVGSVPVASFTVTKLRWLAEHEPRARPRGSRRCCCRTTG